METTLPARLPAPAVPSWIIDELPPVARYRVQAADALMHTMEMGTGKPVVMVHGNPTWGFLYRKVAAALGGDGYRLIIPDLVGLGFSDKRASMEDHTLENHINWFVAWLDAMELDDVVLVVQDWGGAIGVGAMAQRADMLSGLVVLNTALTPPRHGFKPSWFHSLAATAAGDVMFRRLGFPQRALWVAQGDKWSIGRETAAAYTYPLRDSAARLTPLAMARMVPDSHDHPSIGPLQDVADFVESFIGPAAIVWGDKDPVLGKLKNRVARMLPQAPVTSTQAGHFLQEEVPAEIAAAIRFVRG